MEIPRKKEDIKMFMDKMKNKLKNNNGVNFGYYDENLSYNGSTTFGIDQKGWYIFSHGTNWSDQSKTYLSDTEALNYLKQNRKFINNFNKHFYKTFGHNNDIEIY